MIKSQTHYTEQTFRDMHLDHEEFISSEFHDCLFSGCFLVESVFHRCRFVGCTFRECDLSLFRVPDTTFATTRFEECKVVGVNWTEGYWPKAALGEPLTLFKCVISHSTFIGLRLQGIQIEECLAVDVDFREADLSGADFGGTDLSRSLFGSTNLEEADLSRARNYIIDPARNNLKQARFALPEAMSLLHSMDIVLVNGD